jgi:D-threonate/D-erythronate kinase
MRRVLVLADDLTGALEVGAKFAATGLAVLTTIKRNFAASRIQEQAILVIDTETRHIPPDQAGRFVFGLSRAGCDAGFQYVYKKTDSTLRGNIAAELDALSKAFRGSSLLYVPAYPKMGRTVREGILYVDGVPVTETSYAIDSLNPVMECHIPRLLSTECTQPVLSTTTEEFSASLPVGIYVCDGETDSDLEIVARKFLQSPSFRLAAGPTGFVDYLAPLVDLPRTTPKSLPRVTRVLVINGSRNAVSIRQVQHAREYGCEVKSGDEIAGAEENPDWVILDQPVGKCSPVDFARQLSQAVCDILRRKEFEAVVLFGGDTAYATLEALGSPDLHPIGEVLEGIPISAISRNSSGLNGDGFLYLISKAGGFGAVDVLRQIQMKLMRG